MPPLIDRAPVLRTSRSSQLFLADLPFGTALNPGSVNIPPLSGGVVSSFMESRESVGVLGGVVS